MFINAKNFINYPKKRQDIFSYIFKAINEMTMRSKTFKKPHKRMIRQQDSTPRPKIWRRYIEYINKSHTLDNIIYI